MTPAHMALIAAIYLACYLIGSINFSLLAAALLLKKNLRQSGSGNPGFTNLLRLGNKKIAMAVLLLDIGRGLLVLLLCANLSINIFWPFVAVPLLLGNLFPVFHRFKGGKGIAMSIGIVFAVCPYGGLAGIIVLATLIGLWRKVSIGSLGFLISAVIVAALLSSTSVTMVLLIIGVLAFWTHRHNLQRLVRGEEPDLFAPKSPS